MTLPCQRHVGAPSNIKTNKKKQTKRTEAPTVGVLEKELLWWSYTQYESLKFDIKEMLYSNWKLADCCRHQEPTLSQSQLTRHSRGRRLVTKPAAHHAACQSVSASAASTTSTSCRRTYQLMRLPERSSGHREAIAESRGPRFLYDHGRFQQRLKRLLPQSQPSLVFEHLRTLLRKFC